MGNMEIEERRKYIRLEVDAKVDVSAEDNVQEASYGGFSAAAKNICAEGICFTSDNQLRVGDVLKLKVLLEDDAEPFYLKGEVRWSNSVLREGKTVFDTGLRILDIDSNDEQKFVGYVCSRMSRELKKYLKTQAGR